MRRIFAKKNVLGQDLNDPNGPSLCGLWPNFLRVQRGVSETNFSGDLLNFLFRQVDHVPREDV